MSNGMGWIVLGFAFVFTIALMVKCEADCNERHCSAGKEAHWVKYQGCICVERAR